MLDRVRAPYLSAFRGTSADQRARLPCLRTRVTRPENRGKVTVDTNVRPVHRLERHHHPIRETARTVGSKGKNPRPTHQSHPLGSLSRPRPALTWVA